MKCFVNRTGWRYIVQDNYLYGIIRCSDGDIELDKTGMTEEYAKNDPSFFAYEADSLEDAQKMKHPNPISKDEEKKIQAEIDAICNDYCEDEPIKDNTPIYKEDF